MFEKNALLALFKPKIVPVSIEVGEDKFDIFVKELSAAQVFDLQAKQKEVAKSKEADSGNKQFALLLLSEALCDENGERVVSLADAQGMLSMKIAAFNKLTEVVAQAVGLATPEKDDDAGKA